MGLDDRVTLASAEGIDLDLRVAGIASRGAALGVDLLIQVVVILVLGWFLGAFGTIGAALFAIVGFLVLVGYPIVAEASFGGQTIGKRAVGIHAVMDDGSALTFLAAATRGIVRLVDLLPGVGLVGAISILATERSQRLGDLVADTLVVHDSTATARRREAERSGTPEIGFSIPPVLSPEQAGWDVSGVAPEDLVAARSFLARRHQIAPHHRAELADRLARDLLPKVAGVPLDGGPEVFLERVVSARTSR